MSFIEVYINKLTANYSSSCHFKIKIVLISSPYRESVENKHSFKYDKGESEINIYEKLKLKLFHPLTSDSKLQFILKVYTKTGYKTAGVGVFQLSKGIIADVPIQVEIQKCPLGKGILEIQFNNFNLKPSSSAKRINFSISSQIHNDKYINHHNSHSNNKQDKRVTSNISHIVNFEKIGDLSNNYNTNISPNKNFYNIKSNNNSPKNRCNYNIQNTYISKTNNNDDLMEEQDRKINELRIKINYYEEENTELKNLLKDFKKEKKKIVEEKNILLNQQKDRIKQVENERDDLQIQNNSLQENINILKKNKNDSDLKAISLKTISDKQIKDLNQKIQNLNNIKIQLENENKLSEEKIIELDKKYKEMSIDYQKKFSELNNKFSSENNNNFLNYNEKLKIKEEEIIKLNVKMQSMEENIQSLNEIIDLNEKHKNDKNELTENMTKLLSQISSKDKQIFELKKQILDLNDKILRESNNRETQNILKNITEKELKQKINELEKIIKEKDNEIIELREKYENIKCNSNKLKPNIQYIEDNDDDDKENGNNDVLITQIKEIQKTFNEREEKLLKEKNEEIKKLKMKNKELIRGSNLDNNNFDVTKYINEINKLKIVNNNLEEDLGYYKELNNKFMDNEKRATIVSSENIRLQNLLQLKNEEIDLMKQKYKKLEEENNMLERQLVNSKGKLGEVLNELVEAETKCVHLEEEQRQIRKTIVNGGR